MSLKNIDIPKEGTGSKKVRHGTKTADNGDIIEGKIIDNKFEGETTVYYLNKCFFSGDFVNNEKRIGVETFPNGDYYEGEFHEGKFHGHGLLANNRLRYSYEGEFKNGKKHGFGTEIYENKCIYKGEFFNNYRQGKGKIEVPNGAYYEGGFKDGLKHGYGLDVTASLKNIPDKSGALSIMTAEDSIKFHDECFEGEFIQGQRHGIGREYRKDGSYYYGFWQCNEKVGEGIHYYAEKNLWERGYYEKPMMNNGKENPTATFNVLETDGGNPPLHYDCSKSLIDDVAVIEEKVQDIEFSANKESLIGFDSSATEKANIPNVIFMRLSELYESDKPGKYDLFYKTIRPNSFIVTESSNLHILVALEALCYYPHLILNCITPKYFEDLGYFIVKLYFEGMWREVFIDDFIPCSATSKLPILTQSLNEEIGWLVLQKALAKQLGGYFFDMKNSQFTPIILQMLTARSSKIVSCHSEENVLKALNKFRDYRVKIGYLHEEIYEKLEINMNTPYMILDFFLNEFLTAVVVVKTFLNQAVLPHRDKTNFFSKSYLESLDYNPDDPSIIFMGLQEFLEHFSVIHILLGVNEDYVHNIKSGSLTTKDFYEDGNFEMHRFYEFSLNRESNVFLNVEQVNKEENKFYALRIILAQKIQKFNKLATVNLEDTNKNEKEPRKKYLPYHMMGNTYNYRFGKGQRTSRNLMKEIKLDPGDYILMIQIEYIEELRGDNKLIVHIFSTPLLKIKRIQKIQEFSQEVYKQLILDKLEIARSSDQGAHEPQPIDVNFSFSDLREKPNGSDNLLIVQYFLKSEKTYLQFLWNNSENRRWRQRLIYKLENMIFRTQNDGEKVDAVLCPGDQHLVIIQQNRCHPILFEGGDGVCVIEIIEDARKR